MNNKVDLFRKTTKFDRHKRPTGFKIIKYKQCKKNTKFDSL